MGDVTIKQRGDPIVDIWVTDDNGGVVGHLAIPNVEIDCSGATVGKQQKGKVHINGLRITPKP